MSCPWDISTRSGGIVIMAGTISMTVNIIAHSMPIVYLA